jgi:hypothetical protein
MRCEDAAARLADHLAGTLTGRAKAEFDEHLRSCTSCSEEAASMADTWQALGELPAEPADSAAMRARFDAMVDGFEHGRARSTASPVGSWLMSLTWPREIHPLAQAAAAAAFLLVGGWLGRESSLAPAPTADVSAMREEMRDLRQMVGLSLLQQQSASERLRGVSWSSRLDRPGDEVVDALLDTLMHDANINVRLASIDALKRFADHAEVKRTAIEALAQQTSPLVKIALIDFVVEVQEREAVQELRRLREDPTLDDAVRARATWGLERLGGRS